MNRQLNFLEPMGSQIENSEGNKQLVQYGIQTEDSDYRAHVGYKTQHVFVFPTESGRKEVAGCANGLNKRVVSIDGKIISAKGYAIPISSIENIQSVLIPHDIYSRYIILPDMTTSTKGQLAVQIVFEMLKRQLILLPVRVDVADDTAIQVNGADIIVSSKLKIQVKCDFRAGEKRDGGSGNLFLQTEECNPYKLY